jgi:PAS domain-containing protein
MNTDPSAAFDDEGNLLWMNDAMRRLLGYRLEEDLSLAIAADFYEELDYERLLAEVYPRAIARGWRSGLLAMCTKDGRFLETLHFVEAQAGVGGEFETLTIRLEFPKP